MTSTTPLATDLLVFIGGGNMASAILGGLLRQGHPPQHICVVDPDAAIRQSLHQSLGVNVLAAPDASLAPATHVIWAIKPQHFKTAAAQASPFTANALHLSVAAGIRTDSLTQWLRSERIVRAMPNTPALIGQGMAGLYARESVSADERAQVERLFAPTGRSVWVRDEADLDAVTALSGSGPAYGFYLIEAMVEAAQRMGLSAEQGREMAIQTLLGASMLAQQSPLSPAELRAQVTSKGGTTHAAISHLEAQGVKETVVAALLAAQARARELGDEYGR